MNSSDVYTKIESDELYQTKLTNPVLATSSDNTNLETYTYSKD